MASRVSSASRRASPSATSRVSATPEWTDLRSGLRFGPAFPKQCAHLDRLLAGGVVGAPDVVLQFG